MSVGPAPRFGWHRYTVLAAYLHERDGDLATAARLYVEAAHQAPNLAERTRLRLLDSQITTAGNALLNYSLRP